MAFAFYVASRKTANQYQRPTDMKGQCTQAASRKRRKKTLEGNSEQKYHIHFSLRCLYCDMYRFILFSYCWLLKVVVTERKDLLQLCSLQVECRQTGPMFSIQEELVFFLSSLLCHCKHVKGWTICCPFLPACLYQCRLCIASGIRPVFYFKS